MTDPAVARKIDVAAWSTVVLGVVGLGLAALQAILPPLLDRLAASLEASDDPTGPVRGAFASGAGVSAAVNVVFGVALIVVGVGVARRARWAHAAMTAASWGSIVVVVALARPSVAPLAVMAGGGSASRAFTLGVSLALLVAQIAAVAWFLRFWRRPEVRAAFS